MSGERITSRQNPLLRHVKKLQTSRSYRERCGEFVGDGTKLLEEAARWDASLHTVLAADGVPLCQLPETVRVVRVPGDVMESVSQMQSPQGALFVCKIPPARPLRISGGTLILDGIQDPGNLGTMLRTADALDVPVVLTEGCADPYNPKTVRASMGAVFRTPPQQAARLETVEACRAAGVPLLATALSETAQDLRAVALNRCAVIIGSEGSGVCRELLELAQMCVVIPMNPRCESLNAAVAAAIVMWQMKCGAGG